MDKKLFLLDGMALVYRAHFALSARPIFTSKGVNTSALYGFTQTLLEILKNQKPTHIAVAFDTEAPTARHAAYPEYKATRQVMPEDLSLALPHVQRMLDAFRIPTLTCDGWEADDIIGTLVRKAEKEGFKSYMVTPDKDFGQLIDENTFLYKPSRMGDGVEVLGIPEIRQRWGIEEPGQVVDVLALAGDSSDNIPGVPGIGEVTAAKLIGQYKSVENLLAHTSELKGRVKENLEKNRDDALLSKRLVTIDCATPCDVDLQSLKLQPPDEEKVKALLIEFEFNSIGKRLFGDDFKAGRGFQTPARPAETKEKPPVRTEELVLAGEEESKPADQPIPALAANLKTIADVPHEYHLATKPSERAALIKTLQKQKSFSFDAEATHPDPKQARLAGFAFSFAPHSGHYVPIPDDPSESRRVLDDFRPVLESDAIEKIGHNLKFAANLLKWHGLALGGKLFDSMIAHSLIEPDMRHSRDFLSEAYLGYSPLSREKVFGESNNAEFSFAIPIEKRAEFFTEAADVALQLRAALEPQLKDKGQERVFYEIESPLIPVLADMEYEGIRVDADALADFGAQLSKQIAELEKTICHLAGTNFNLNSPRQLGQILFDVLKICEKPKKTKTGQYATDEQTLMTLAPDHEIVRRLLEHRVASKLKSTYADALPVAIWPKTGRIHTTFYQVATSTGRLNSQDPNLQNIPIRSERGQEIRKAFVPRVGRVTPCAPPSEADRSKLKSGAHGVTRPTSAEERFLLLSADYSQIELRIIAALTQEPGLLEAFRTGMDVHTATAAKVFGVFPELVTPEMRRKAKMVNYGISYGISAFGLAQRLGIPRREGAEIIDQYFKQFPGIRKYMDDTIAFGRKHGYVQTVTGRRRYIRDITSSNNTVRGGAERNAINAPIQGSAADLIKLAMIHIQRELTSRKLTTRMLLQVHDELVFDLFAPEEKEVSQIVTDKMQSAIKLDVPIEVEIGIGENWLEAH